ncbi:MAG: DUF5715 family protein [Blastocatellia bacterium]
MNRKQITRPRASQLVIAALCFLSVLLFANCRSNNKTQQPPPPTVEAQQIDPWKEAAHKVEEDRGEPVGRKAQIEVPAELQHYSDRRRFLAVQVAESRELAYRPPLDYSDLVELIQKKQIVEMEPLGHDYIIYGVGGNASDEPFQHYDPQTGQNVPLYATDEEFRQEDEKLTESLREPTARLVDLQAELRKTPKRDRTRRNLLTTQAAEMQRSITAIDARKKLIDSFYKNPEQKKRLLADHKALYELASDFNGKSYDLNDPKARLAYKVRLLSFIRPEARDLLLEIARSYKDKFDRPLPITSLIRPEQYQKRLSETNANATRISSPPHATGLAFDVYNYYMTSAEQSYLMWMIAKLESEGRVEALRENRDHIHVFVFPDGQRPAENLIAQEINHRSAESKSESKNKRGKKATTAAQAQNGRRSR